MNNINDCDIYKTKKGYSAFFPLQKLPTIVFQRLVPFFYIEVRQAK